MARLLVLADALCRVYILEMTDSTCISSGEFENSGNRADGYPKQVVAQWNEYCCTGKSETACACRGQPSVLGRLLYDNSVPQSSYRPPRFGHDSTPSHAGKVKLLL